MDKNIKIQNRNFIEEIFQYSEESKELKFKYSEELNELIPIFKENSKRFF